MRNECYRIVGNIKSGDKCRGATRAAADLFFANREPLARSENRSEVAAVLLVSVVYY